MKPYIDIHSHVAWGIDDGMPTYEDAREALAQAKADGIRAIASTPHLIPGFTDLNKLIARQEELKTLAKEQGILIRTGAELFMNRKSIDVISEGFIRPYEGTRYQLRQEELKTLAKEQGILIRTGAELFMNRKSIDVISEGFIRPYEGTRYQLCEYDLRRDIQDIDYADEPLYELEVKGLTPVIAHVERYFSKHLDLDLIQRWHDAGYVIQINRTSINGNHGKIAKENAFKILDAGLAHVVASDTHRASGTRVEKLSDAWQILADRYGEANADLLLSDNPKAILENRDVEDMEATVKKKKRFLFF